MMTALLAFAAGAVIAWLVGSAVAKSQTAAAEARVEELRKQVEAARQGFDGLRAKLEESERAKVEAETRVVEMDRRFADQQALLDKAKHDLSDTFKALASEALAANNKGFLTLAEQKFEALKDGAEMDLATRQEAIHALITPLQEALKGYQDEARTLEDRRLKELGAVGQQLGTFAASAEQLRLETAKLANALRSPQVRGRWGEITLRRCAELAGMVPYCDFIEQETVTGEDGRLRPDMVVRLPAGREIVVDSKVPLAGYLEALEATTDEARHAALQQYAERITHHVGQLSDKRYWEQFPSAEFVILFIPNDSFLAAATEKNPTLVEAALTKRVILATPATFFAVLRAVAFGWRQESLAENAQKISELGQELSDRIATVVEHVNNVGAALQRAVESYNKAASSFESRLLPSARKFKELGAPGKKEIEELAPIDQAPRLVSDVGPTVGV